MPVQDFGNAFSTFIAQNFGAKKEDRIRQGIRSAFLVSFFFCLAVSLLVCIFARPLMQIFVSADETQIIEAGVHYLRIEGSCYLGIGILFLLYGLYRAIARPGMSVVLTVISLGTRVLLAYTLSMVPWIGGYRHMAVRSDRLGFSRPDRNLCIPEVEPAPLRHQTGLLVCHNQMLASVYKGTIRSKPRNFGDFLCYPHSAYVQYASIVCLEKPRKFLRLESVSREGADFSPF